MKYIILFFILFILGCKPYEGGLVKEFPPQQFCVETGGEWKKIPKQPEDSAQGIFDVDKHADYNHKCFCPEQLAWTNTGCK